MRPAGWAARQAKVGGQREVWQKCLPRLVLSDADYEDAATNLSMLPKIINSNFFKNIYKQKSSQNMRSDNSLF